MSKYRNQVWKNIYSLNIIIAQKEYRTNEYNVHYQHLENKKINDNQFAIRCFFLIPNAKDTFL